MAKTRNEDRIFLVRFWGNGCEEKSRVIDWGGQRREEKRRKRRGDRIEGVICEEGKREKEIGTERNVLSYYNIWCTGVYTEDQLLTRSSKLKRHQRTL